MKRAKKEFKYGKPIEADEIPHPRRLPQYDDCLREFLGSGCSNWEVDITSLPSQKPRVVLSSLKWRIKNRKEFSIVQAFMSGNKIYLKRKKHSK